MPKRRAPSKAELALDGCLAAGMPPALAARVAERTSAEKMSEAGRRRLTRRLTKLLELAKSWGAFGADAEEWAAW